MEYAESVIVSAEVVHLVGNDYLCVKQNTMAKKYAVYKLEKVKGKKEYVISSYTIWNSLRAAYNDLESWDEDLDGPRTYNRKTGDFVAYELHDRMLYVPNDGQKEVDGVLRPYSIGVYGRFPIYYIDVYPNPYSYYKLRKVRGSDDLVLEGIE